MALQYVNNTHVSIISKVVRQLIKLALLLRVVNSN